MGALKWCSDSAVIYKSWEFSVLQTVSGTACWFIPIVLLAFSSLMVYEWKSFDCLDEWLDPFLLSSCIPCVSTTKSGVFTLILYSFLLLSCYIGELDLEFFVNLIGNDSCTPVFWYGTNMKPFVDSKSNLFTSARDAWFKAWFNRETGEIGSRLGARSVGVLDWWSSFRMEFSIRERWFERNLSKW